MMIIIVVKIFFFLKENNNQILHKTGDISNSGQRPLPGSMVCSYQLPPNPQFAKQRTYKEWPYQIRSLSFNTKGSPKGYTLQLYTSRIHQMRCLPNFILIYVGDEPFDWPITEKMKLQRLPKIEGSILKYRVPSLWPKPM